MKIDIRKVYDPKKREKIRKAVRGINKELKLKQVAK